MKQRILVTGGAGFIGSHTVALLLEQGHDVLVIDNLSSGKLENLALHHPHLEFVEGDVLDYTLLEEMLPHCDAVLHLAAIASVPQSIENPIYTFQVNTQGFLHVLQAISKASHPIRLVYASSAAVYGEASQLPCRDNEPCKGAPLSPYALQKIQAEQYADLYARLHGIHSLALRYFNVYGPRQDPHSPYSGVISRFLNAYLDNQPVTIFGDGLQSRDFIYVTDVARANALALQSDYHGVLNIATAIPQTLLAMLAYLEKAGKKPLKLQFAPARAGDIISSYGSAELAKQKLDFHYAISLQAGVALLLDEMAC